MVVSIRTRPESRVMPAYTWPGRRALVRVSIRTRPESRVMHFFRDPIPLLGEFQSAPGPKAG